MQIVPYVGESPLHTSQFSIQVDPEDRKRVENLTERARAIVIVNNNDTFAVAKHCAGQMKALLDEIEDARKASQRPQKNLQNAINEFAQNVAAPLQTENARVLGLLNAHVERLEREEKAAQRKREEILRAQMAEQQRKLEEARNAQAAAESEARRAKDEVEALRLKAEIKRRNEAAEDAQLAKEMAMEAAKIGQQAVPKPKVPGGRVDHLYEFELVNVEQVVKAGSFRLLRWELDKLACKDAVKAQLEINPDGEPSLPGIRITRKTSVSVRATV